MIDFNKPVYWNGTLIVHEDDKLGAAWFAPDENGNAIEDFFEVFYGDGSGIYTYLYFDEHERGPTNNYGWNDYEPLPLSNEPGHVS